MPIRRVHVVFKSHLDIGFTDTAEHVIGHYLRTYIPQAIALAEQVDEPGKPPLFVWTVGAYLIDHALRTYGAAQRERLEEAVRKGYIAYHALPFTLHSELCDAALFQAALGIAARLDARFGRRTIAAKMSDVPGHTISIVPPLAAAGVRFLHIGINDVACGARVPPVFWWEAPTGERILVNYARGYGGLTKIEGHDEALIFLHAGDNTSPPGRPEIEAAFASLRAQFPGAEVFASTLDAFAQGLDCQGALPVVKGEIGDTWIHGVDTDPAKTASLRALLRLNARFDAQDAWQSCAPLADGRSARTAFLEALLLVCEHTWGLDAKKYLTDYRNWNCADFLRARRRNWLSDAYGDVPGYETAFRFARCEFERQRPEGIEWPERSYAYFEASHAEQRAYIARAVEALPAALRAQARKAAQAPWTDTPASQKASAPAGIKARAERICLPLPGGHALEIGLPIYQETGLEAYERLLGEFLEGVEAQKDWAIPDNYKPGLEYSDAPRESVEHLPAMEGGPNVQHGAWRWQGVYPEAAVTLAGCPARCMLTVRQTEAGALLFCVKLMGKAANRKPEAIFLPLALPGAVRISLLKVGSWVDPASCVRRGNARVHGVQALRFIHAAGAVCITPLDTPLVALGAPSLLDFDGPKDCGRVYAALYNNLWGTNFPMWYEENITARFLVEME